jgi:adenine-specific DNA-methyltransferase
MQKLEMKSKDIVRDNIEKIAALFPNVITEAEDEKGQLFKAVDFELLKQELSDRVVDGDRERYQLTWPGKNEAIVFANMPTTKTLRPVKEDSVDWDNTENLYIEGDNLEVLKILQESYLNKIKCIYIDPPYNTGKDFVYKDNFKQSREEYLAESGQVDDDGNRLFQNTESNGRFHSDWLSMMCPRLKLAKNLLREDGVIFISIDDSEAHNLRKICDEVFGETNFIAQLVWKKKTGAGSGIQHVFDEHEYVIVYGKSKSAVPQWRILSERDGNFQNPDNDERGPWESCAFTAPSKNRNPNQLFMIEVHFDCNDKEITCVDEEGRAKLDCFTYEGSTVVLRDIVDTDDANYTYYDDQEKVAKFIRRWAYTKQNIGKVFEQRKVFFNKGNIPRFKKFRSDYEGKALRSIYYEDFSTQQGTDALRALFGESLVEYPKPIGLLKHITTAVMSVHDTMLDFFSGSATTAHAVMQLNAEDGGNRKYIMVQLPEPCPEDSEAYKAGFKNISEIGKERIRRAAQKIKEETGADIDYGFRVFKADSSNMKDVYYRPEELTQQQLIETISNIKEDRTGEDLLVHVMLEWGLELSLPMKKRHILGKEVHSVAGNSLVACFDEGVSEELVREIAKEKPLRVVFRDSSFVDDAARINVEELFKMLSPATEIKVI